MAPSRQQITALFGSLATAATAPKFLASIADDVDWWIVGNTSMSGHYHSKQEYLKAMTTNLNTGILEKQLELKVVRVVGGGDEEWAAVEIEADGKLKTGKAYPMKYCWMVRFGASGLIEQVRAYFDTQMLAEATADMNNQG